MKRKLLAALLVSVMAITSVACGNSADPGSAAGTEGNADSSAAADSDSAAASDTAAGEESAKDSDDTADDNGELITLRSVAEVDNITLENCLNGVGETMEDNRWNDLIAKELGYKIEYLWVSTDNEQYKQKLNTSLAAGDVPDIVRLGAAEFAQAARNGVLADLTDAYEEYASPLLREIMNEAGDLPMESATIDGKMYAIPLCDADIERGSLLWIRKDWLDATGHEVPTTIDEMIEVMKAFNEYAGPGAVGLTLRDEVFWLNSNYCLNGFANAFGAYPELWVEQDGALVYGNVQPEMKDALAKLAQMYQEGLIDPEFVVKDEPQAAEAIVSGKSGIFYGAHWSPLSGMLDNIKMDENAEWIPVHLPSADADNPTKVGIQMATNLWFAAGADSPAPQAVIEIANLYVEKIFDREKQEYEYYSNPGGAAEGLWKLCPVFMATPHKNIDITNAIRPYLEANTDDTEGLFGEEKTMYDYARAGMNGDREMAGWNLVFGLDGACQVQNEQQIQPGNTMMDVFYGAPTETMSSTIGVLNSALKAEYIKIITGQLDIDAFDTAVEAWYTGGGQAITDEVNEWNANKG